VGRLAGDELDRALLAAGQVRTGDEHPTPLADLLRVVLSRLEVVA
jgi:hypothetical protein